MSEKNDNDRDEEKEESKKVERSEHKSGREPADRPVGKRGMKGGRSLRGKR